MMRSLKLLLSGILFFFASNLQAQEIELLDSAKINGLDGFIYFNASVEKELKLEESTPILVDFSLTSSYKNYDSVIVSFGNKQKKFTSLQPFLLKSINETTDFKIKLYANAQDPEEIGFKVKVVERPVFISDKVVFGILLAVLAFIFYTSHTDSRFWTKFYRVIPALLLCYLVPAILDMLGLISKEYSGLYPMARDYLLPAALVLMTIGIDFKGVIKLGPKALIMFFTATVGVIIGGPVAIIIYSWIDPSVVGGEGFEATWRGMSTIAGSWIGGGANQNAMFETYRYAPELYGRMIVVDVVVANIWMAVLLLGAARAAAIDRWLKADSSSIESLKTRMSDYQSSNARVASLTDLIVILGVTFLLVAFSHFVGDDLAVIFEGWFGGDSPFASSFFWLVVIATTGGLLLSLTRFRKYEGAGASKIGSVFIYILVATIGMKMELEEALKEPQLILVGIIWMIVHVAILLIVAKIIKAPFFFVAVGSKANIGGAASAPIIASAFHPSLASVGAILAVLGYALGTYGAILCAEMMSWVAP